MASKDELDRLRREAFARHKAATDKVSRLNRQRGVRLSGTKQDPRRARSNINRYTAKQLKSYIGELNQFVSRSTQYVPDAHKRPVPGTLWQQYKALEKRYNAKVEKEFRNVADVHVPSQNMTVAERMAMMTPTHRHMADQAVNSPYDPPIRKPSNVASEKGLKRLIKDMQDRLKPSHANKLRSGAYGVLDEMSRTLNRSDIAAKAKELTPEQFDVLWNYTSFPDRLSLGYDQALKMLSGKDKPYTSQVLELAIDEAESMVEWAANLNLGS